MWSHFNVAMSSQACVQGGGGESLGLNCSFGLRQDVYGLAQSLHYIFKLGQMLQWLNLCGWFVCLFFLPVDAKCPETKKQPMGRLFPKWQLGVERLQICRGWLAPR